MLLINSIHVYTQKTGRSYKVKISENQSLPRESREEGRAMIVCCTQLPDGVAGNIKASSSSAVGTPAANTPIPPQVVAAVPPVNTVAVILAINQNSSVAAKLVILEPDIAQLLL